MPKYAKIGHKGLNKQKTKKTKKPKKQKNQRFLETVGIGGMSLVFFLVFSGPKGRMQRVESFHAPKGRMQRVESCHLFFFLPVNAYVKTENV